MSSPTNDDLMREMRAMREDLQEHIETEEPVLMEARALIAAHGASALVAPRVQFINAWMEREADRKALRRAIIEKTTVAAIWAVLIYLAVMVREDLLVVIRGGH